MAMGLDVIIGSGNGLSSGNKPETYPMLTKICDAIWYHKVRMSQ